MKIFVVLGMHRSATSLVAKGLKENGVNIGERLMGAGQFNKWGHFEDLDFVDMNERILRENRISWDKPGDVVISQETKRKLKELIDRKKDNSDFWGWKDPRTSLMIDKYLPYIENEDIHFICCFRKIENIAKSLQKRDGFSLEKGKKIAKEYIKRILNFLSSFYFGEV